MVIDGRSAAFVHFLVRSINWTDEQSCWVRVTFKRFQRERSQRLADRANESSRLESGYTSV